MSRLFRNRRNDGSAWMRGNTIAARNANVDTSTQDNAPLQSGVRDVSTLQAFPIQREIEHVNAQAYYPASPTGGLGDAYDDRIDFEIGGQRGEVGYMTYSTGVVSSDLMENFALTGEQAVIRRPRNPSDIGPVGTSDHNTLLSLAYAQAVNQFYPNERSQADIIRSV